MNNSSDSSVLADPLDAIVADYLQQVEAGTTPDREALLAAHPELGERLRAFFADLDRLGPQACAFHLPDMSLPDDFGDYEIESEIGRGGMGVVYQARQVSLNRPVALKMILGGWLVDPAAVARFRDEAETAARLDHPNIVPIHEVGDQRGHPYFSMKRIDGQSLSKCLEQYRDPKAAVELLIKVCRAVQHAHQRGVLHRDLKPGNILVDADGEPHVTDFGLARRIEEARAQTLSGVVVGTPESMAPEQAAGAKDLTTAVDVYGLGAVLYALLTGRPPFQTDGVYKTLRAVMEDEPVAPSRLRPRVPRDLEVICLKSLSKEPGKRYPSAEALADDLQRWLKGEPIQARRVGRIERFRMWAKRRPMSAALLKVSIASVLALIASAVIFTWQLRRTNTQLTESNDSLAKTAADLKKTNEERDASNRQLEEYLWLARREVFNLQMMRVAACYESDPKKALALLHDYEACPINERDTSWHYYERAAVANYRATEPGLLITRWPTIHGKVFLPESARPHEPHQGRMWALICAGGSLANWNNPDFKEHNDKLPLQIVDLCSGEVRATLNQMINVSGHRFPRSVRVVISQDGNTIAWIEETDTDDKSKVLAYDVVAKRVVDCGIELDTHATLEFLTLSADGALLFLRTHPDSLTRVFDTRTGKELFRSGKQAWPNAPPAFAPDGSKLAWQGKHAEKLGLHVMNLATFQVTHSIPVDSFDVFGFSPDSKHIIRMGWRKNLNADREEHAFFVYDLRQDARLVFEYNLRRRQNYMHFSPDGRYVGVGGMDGFIYVFETATWTLKRALGGGSWNFTFHGDGNEVAAHGEEGGNVGAVRQATALLLKAWNLETGAVRLLRSGDFGKLISWNRKNELRSFVFDRNYDPSQLYQWNLTPVTSGRTIPDVPGRCIKDMHFSPDGKAVYFIRTVIRRASDDSDFKEEFRTRSTPSEYELPDGRKRWQYYYNETLVYDVPVIYRYDIATGKTTVREGAVPSFNEKPARKPNFADPWGDDWKLETDDSPRLINARTGRVRPFPIERGSYCEFLGITPDGQSALLNRGFGSLELWDVWSGHPRAALSGHTAPIDKLVWQRDGRRLVTRSKDGTIKLWDFDTPALGNWEAGECVVFAPNGERLFTDLKEATIAVDLATGREDDSNQSRRHSQNPLRAAITPDGKYQISGEVYSIQVVDTATRQRVAQVEEQLNYQRWMVSPDGSFVLRVRRVPTDPEKKNWQLLISRLRIPELEERELIRVPKDISYPENLRLHITGDGGQIVLSHGYNSWKWINAQNGEVIQEKEFGDKSRWQWNQMNRDGCAPLLHPQGVFLLTVNDESRVCLRDSSDGKVKWTLPQYDYHYLRAVFSADGRWLATADRAGDIRVWEVETGEEAARFSIDDSIAGTLSKYVKAIAFAPKGDRIAVRVDFEHRTFWAVGRTIVWNFSPSEH